MEVRFITKEELVRMRFKSLDSESNTWVFWDSNEILFVIRTGKCEYNKCKNLCCKFCVLPYPHEYWEGFAEKSKIQGALIMKKKCKFLKKCGECSKWGIENQNEENLVNGRSRVDGFPRACQQFPTPSDQVYYEVFYKCSFKFKVLHSVKRLGERIRKQTVEEMLRSFKLQDD